jgi:glycosyltransferase involved in cell wall biosynthesis
VRITVIVPAQNEEQRLPLLLDSIGRAAEAVGRAEVEVETLVVAHRCTDRTVEVAESHGANVFTLHHPTTVGGVRNVGGIAARGDVFVTLDADAVLPEHALRSMVEALDDGECVGGAARERIERRSLGIGITMALVHLGEAIGGLGGGMYWCRREDWHAIGGYNDRLGVGSNHDFARRLREHGRHSGRRFVNLDVDVRSSSRRFDQHGDWHQMRDLVRPARLWGVTVPPEMLDDVELHHRLLLAQQSSETHDGSATSLRAL